MKKVKHNKNERLNKKLGGGTDHTGPRRKQKFMKLEEYKNTFVNKFNYFLYNICTMVSSTAIE